MRTVRLAAIAAALTLVPLGLAACGGGSDNSQDNNDITAVITRASTSGDPAACTDSQTQKFTEQTSGPQTGAAAVKSCETDAADTAATSADVSNISVNGDTADADAAFTGSILDGQALSLGLVKEGGTWKVDSVKSFTSFDSAKFVAAFEAELAKQPDIPASAQACLKQQFDSATEAQLQAIILTPNGGDELFSACGG